MAATEGFSIEISSRYDGWWRYNAALMCGCFDAGDERIGFASAESHVADVGANLTAKPADMAGDRSLRLETTACDHLLLYIYIVPHTLPAGNDIADTQPSASHTAAKCSAAKNALSTSGRALRSKCGWIVRTNNNKRQKKRDPVSRIPPLYASAYDYLLL